LPALVPAHPKGWHEWPRQGFISIASAEGSNAIPLVYGIMLSTYLHDLDRSLIASTIPLAQEDFVVSRALIDALFIHRH
jgi:hypothetical protein